MEKNDRHYPNQPLIGKYTLDSLLQSDKLTNYMDKFDDDEDDQCDTGFCFR